MKKIVLNAALFLFVPANACSAQDSRTVVSSFCNCLKTAVVSVEHPIDTTKGLLEKVNTFELEHPSLTRMVGFAGSVIMTYFFLATVRDLSKHYHNKKKLAALKEKKAALHDHNVNQKLA